jgi:hypothetical protein
VIGNPYSWRINMTEETGTTAFEFNSGDIEGLIAALGDMAGKLSEGEWGLLLSVFAVASDHVDRSEDGRTGTFSGVGVKDGSVIKDPSDRKVGELRKQLQKAYMPGGSQGAPLRDMVSPPFPSPPPNPPPPPNPSPPSN